MTTIPRILHHYPDHPFRESFSVLKDWQIREFRWSESVAMGGVFISESLELVRPLDELLSVEVGCFVGFEKPGTILGSVLGFTPNHPAVLDLIAVGEATDFLSVGYVGKVMDVSRLFRLWLDDERVGKFSDLAFNPVPIDQPWKASRPIGPDTFGITHWEENHTFWTQG